jgi:Uri superfamily endonuclease
MNWQPVESPRAALLVRPRGAVSLHEAHLAIDQWEFYSHKTLDDGQRAAVELAMAENRRGRWAARTTGLSEPRQNGKGDVIEVIESWGLVQRAEAIVHSAHEIPTAKSAHLRMVDFLGHRDLRRRVSKVRYANGDQNIEMRNGGTIVYRTRTAGGGRGLDDISRLVCDEAQHAQPEQLASATPIMAANPNPQLNFVGTSAISGRSDWWWTIRKRALANDGGGFAYLEFSAEHIELNRDGRVVSVPPDPHDRQAWATANQGLGSRIEEAFLAEQLRVLGPELFAREHLGVWDPYTGEEGGVVPFDRWQAEQDTRSTVASSLSYGLSVSADGTFAAVGSAGRRADGRIHVDNVRHEKGTRWVVDYLRDLHSRRRTPIRVNPAAAEGAFIRTLREEKIEVVEVGGRQYQQACGDFLESVKNDQIRHLGQELLSRAVAVADRRDIGLEGGWVWTRSGYDITPLIAATLAISGVEARRVPRIHTLQGVS